jgi:pimeloyl-ACP methyl ester carboxylesterase
MTAATNLAGLEPKDLVVAGISIHYYTGGEGEPLLLLHGLAGSSGTWVELLPDLVRRHRVIAVDLPGHAGSAKAPRGTSISDFAAVATAVLEAEVEGPALVAGHSFGGLVALRLARARPELVRG